IKVLKSLKRRLGLLRIKNQTQTRLIHFLNKFCYYHILNYYISYYTCVILSIFFFFSYGKKKFSSHNKKYFVDPDRLNEDFVTTNFSSRSHTFVMIRLDCSV